MSPEMRIIGGAYKGRKITSLGEGYRPTTAIIKRSLFDTLGPDIEGSRFLDLFAGCGAIGLEALSRGAGFVCFVEREITRVASISRNLDKLGIEDNRFELLGFDYSNALSKLRDRNEIFDYIYTDPPYEGTEPKRILGDISTSKVLAEDGIIVYETARRDTRRIAEAVPRSLWPLKERTHGGTALVFLRWREQTDSGTEQ